MMKNSSALVIALSAMLLWPVAIEAQQPVANTARQVLPELKPGDGVRLAFWRDPEMNGDFYIDETGTLTLPLIGRRSVAGVPADQLKRDLISELQAQLANQSVQLTLLIRVRIVGAVQKPGLYHIDPTLTLGDAVALAGGATPNGTLRKIRIIRGNQHVLSLSADDPVVADVRSGDQIEVAERSWLSRNGGVVIGAAISALGFIVAQAAF